MARQIVEVADRQDETTYKLVGHRLLGTMQFLKGQNREALKNLQKAERSAIPPGRGCSVIGSRMTPASRSLAGRLRRYVCPVRWTRHRGSLSRCRSSCPITRMRPLSLPASGSPWSFQTFCRAILRLANAIARHSANIAPKKGGPLETICRRLSRCARTTRDPSQENIAALRDAIDVKHRSGASVGDSLYLSQLAEALLRTNEVSGAERR